MSGQRRQSAHTGICAGPRSRTLHSARNVLGTHAAPVSHLLFAGSHRKSQQLLPAVHHVDESEDKKDIRGEKHVRFQAHKTVRSLVHRETRAHGGLRHAGHAPCRLVFASIPQVGPVRAEHDHHTGLLCGRHCGPQSARRAEENRNGEQADTRGEVSRRIYVI